MGYIEINHYFCSQTSDDMKTCRIFAVVICAVVALVLIFGLLYLRWRHLWALDEARPAYEMIRHHDDTLRVVMIGDSWAGLHQTMMGDTVFQALLSREVGRPVLFRSSGKGGEKRRGIYHLMFQDDGYGTRPLLVEHPDFCIISAGINDAAANLGPRQYCHYYRLILTFLLDHQIRPVVLEMPDVDIWHIYGGKPMKDRVGDFLKSVMTDCRMYSVTAYREALFQMLNDEALMDQIVYIPVSRWNRNGLGINQSLFMDDLIHLNLRGYELLDLSIANAIKESILRLLCTSHHREQTCSLSARSWCQHPLQHCWQDRTCRTGPPVR